MFAQKLNSYKLKSSCKLIILILLYLPIHSFGQDCVVHGLDEFNQWFVQNRRSIEEAELRFSQEKALRTAKMVSVPIQFHIVLDSGGNSELDEDMIDEAIENLNSYYEGANLSFFACGRPILLINSSFFEFDPDEEDALLEESYKDDVINIYCVNEMGNLNGYTYLPGAVDKDFIIIRSDRITTTTLPHEMGHYMGLKHTHGDQNCPSVMPATKELVNGSNCQTAGDQICDTPADPGMSGLECEERQYDSNCRYIGTSRDANGQLFKPDPKNIMSYAHPCRSYFSAGQSARMNAIFFEERSYLACQKEVDCDPPSEINLVDKDYSYFYIKWDDVSPTDTYSWRYRKQAESTWETSDEWESTGIVSSLKTPCTNYIFQVRSVCDEDGNFGDWSEELEFKTEGCSDSYCYSYGVAFGDWIKSVKFSNLESTSETNYGYVNLIDKIARVEPSKTYSLSLGAGYNTSKTRGDTYYWQVWIDFNQDNDFSDAGELVFSSTSSKASSVAGLSKDILIPASAKAGKTRMMTKLF